MIHYEPAGEGIDFEQEEPKYREIASGKSLNRLGPLDELDNEDHLLVHNMAGNEKFRTKIKDLVIEYRDIFSTTLGPEPAYLPPMELEVDKSIWECQPIERLLDLRRG